MTTLAELMLAPDKRERVAAQLASWIRDHVAAARGISGFGMKAGLKALQAVRHDALERGVDRLIPDIVQALEPLFQQCCTANEKDFGRFLASRNDDATAAIMGAVDRRVTASQHTSLVPVYRRLRGAIESELRKTLPQVVNGIGQLVSPR